MSAYLTATDRPHLAAARQTMLSPLVYGDRCDCMIAVNDHVRDFVVANHRATFLDGDGLEYVSGDTDTGPLEPLEDMVLGWDDAGFAGFTRTEAPLPIGEVTAGVAYARSDADGYRDEGLQRLGFLVAAHEAGVRAWRRMAGVREMLDSLRNALAVFGPGGRTLFRSRALDRLLRNEPMASRVTANMRETAGHVTRWGSRGNRKPATPERANMREVTTGLGEYRLWASPLRPALFGTSAVLVQVERADAVLPTPAEIQTRFGLTPREAEVALLLAEGLDNRSIAGRLSISSHTVRRHTESVLRGLGIASRAAVAVTLLRRA